jgi:DNA polymerase-3 subunit gamma/tau
MTLLRLLAFEPASGDDAAEPAAPVPAREAPAPRATPRAGTANVAAMRAPANPPDRADGPSGPARPAAAMPLPADAAAWPAFVAGLGLTGMAAQLAAQSELRSVQGNVVTLALAGVHKHLAEKAYADKLKVALEARTGRKLLLAFEIGDAPTASLAAQEKQAKAAARAAAEQALRDEPFVRDALARFDARIKPESVEPLAGRSEA